MNIQQYGKENKIQHKSACTVSGIIEKNGDVIKMREKVRCGKCLSLWEVEFENKLSESTTLEECPLCKGSD